MFDREAIYKSITNSDAPNFAEWQRLANSVASNRIEGSINYFKFFFPVSLRLFKAVLEKQKQKGEWCTYIKIEDHYDALISIVGLTPEPLIHTICALSPTAVYPVVTKEVLSHYTKKYDNLDLKKYFQSWINNTSITVQDPGRVISSDDSLDTFRKVKEIVEGIRERQEFVKIAIDVTGGKKSSVVSAFFMAAIEKDIDIFYVDFEKYDTNINKPLCGTEFLNKLDNPYDIYNIREESIMQELWKRQDFDAVYNLLLTILDKFTEHKAFYFNLKNYRNRLIQIQAAANCYRAWSKFNYSLAYENAKSDQTSCVFFNYYQLSHDNILSKLLDCVDLRKSAYGAILLALDRWKRGEDALTLEEFDKSALCFTQAIEILCSYRLFDLSTKNLLEGGKFEFGANQSNGKQHSPKTNGSIKFLFSGEKQENAVQFYNTGLTLKWKNDNSLRFHEKLPELTISRIIEYLDIRNEFAHFTCFSREKIEETTTQMLQFQTTTKLFIELFIFTYNDQPDLNKQTLDMLKAPLKFAEFADFNFTV